MTSPKDTWYARQFPDWDPQAHPYLCPCGRCDGTGDPIGAVKVLGAFYEQPDGSFRETEEKDKS